MHPFGRARAAAFSFVLLARSFVAAQNGTYIDPSVLDACPGYDAQNVSQTANVLSADLVLAGTACNVFGNDVEKLKLEVSYETGMFFRSDRLVPRDSLSRSDTRIHLKITDPSTPRYEVPESVFARPSSDFSASRATTQISFNYTTSPFSFAISRTQTGEVLFNTTSHPIIFESQYLRVKTSLPTNANIYGLGEHTEAFRLPTYNLTRTLWSRDAVSSPFLVAISELIDLS